MIARTSFTEVSITEPREYGDINRDCIVLLDTGTKYSIIRNILRMGYRVVRVRWDTPFEKIMSYRPKGVVISNGPGDPQVCKVAIETASEFNPNHLCQLWVFAWEIKSSHWQVERTLIN